MLQFRYSAIHLQRFGYLSSVINVTPDISSRIPLQKAVKLPTISAKPILSPPKNFLSLSSLSRIFRASPASFFAFSYGKKLT
ncbi:hypothetical protein Leryth_000051 [Lithospermum erythrorhizon]|nr:hypothetical protein Leryth_000051 [Lithospermum erythrorhizon]